MPYSSEMKGMALEGREELMVLLMMSIMFIVTRAIFLVCPRRG